MRDDPHGIIFTAIRPALKHTTLVKRHIGEPQCPRTLPAFLP
jgi:hypothetical protein